MKAKEVYVLLSDLCNFKCEHCLNSSGPQSQRWRLSEPEIQKICSDINADPQVQQIHFSGGEPSLHLDWLKLFKKNLREDVTWAMTSNGWFGSRLPSFFEGLRFDKISLSFDSYHLPYISAEKLTETALKLKDMKIEVDILFTFEGPKDLLLTKAFKDAGIPVQFCQIVESGRHDKEVHQGKSLQTGCPSLPQESRALEKINYIPGKGYTYCCGPLAFDSHREDSFLYTGELKNMGETPLYKELTSEAFLANYQNSDQSICHFCVNYLSKAPQ